MHRYLLPHSLKLSADQVSGAQMVKATIRQWFGTQIGPEMILHAPRFQARARVCCRARDQVIVLEQGETRLSI